MVFENGTKQPLVDEETRRCREISTSSLDTIIEIVVNMAEPLSEGKHAIDMKLIPPFITHLVYKTAAVLTRRLQVDSESRKPLEQLKSLRNFLQSAGHRWLGASESLRINKHNIC